jgi:nucleoside diphosphate kinase
VQRTLALVKPDACGRPWIEVVQVRDEDDPGDEDAPRFKATEERRAEDKADEIVKRIEAAGFRIVERKLTRLSVEQARAFYAEHRGKPFFAALTAFMSSGPVLALALERVDAIAAWRALMGPTNPAKAREAAEAAHPLDDGPWPLRALFGADTTHNATHGSDAPFTAMRELHAFFPAPAGAPWSRSVVAATADAVAAGRVEAIVTDLESRGLWVVAQRAGSLTPAAAAVLGAARPGQAVSAAAAARLSAGPGVVFVVEGPDAVMASLLAVGPPSVDKAKDCAPDSLRARFATDDTKLMAFAAADADAADAAVAAVWPDGALPWETTLALVKPGAADAHAAAVLREVAARGFVVLAERRTRLSAEDAETF